jgi:hypothetical protein
MPEREIVDYDLVTGAQELRIERGAGAPAFGAMIAAPT